LLGFFDWVALGAGAGAVSATSATVVSVAGVASAAGEVSAGAPVHGSTAGAGACDWVVDEASSVGHADEPAVAVVSVSAVSVDWRSELHGSRKPVRASV
jgi:hypothetical protein